ncbi:hypothetical protein [Flavobacterium terrisoli]|uniref:hypothetical protein n=1 Tax=Flavobacterium terrisoli TaxID=3242195 RepID=UPI0025434AA4|nr:hypothetical protein [Flavobacterium buctense]
MRNIFFLITILLFSCNSKTNEKTAIEEPVYKAPKITGAKYFNYDELIHYKSEIEENKLRGVDENKHKSELDSLKYNVILRDIPKSIKDTGFINKLEKLGYSKTEVGKEKFEEINKIFVEKKHKEIIGYACDYVYRDILIFKHKSKTIGIAKLCFGCNGNQIVGTKANTEEFGMDGDYEKLAKILESK